jgi:probable phosphoglycerate mutase
VIVTSEMRRARETGEGIAEVIGARVESDPDLFEIRQSDAFYDASPDFGATHMLNWMPGRPTDQAEPGAESFEEIVARVHRFRERIEARAAERILAVSHFGFLHFVLGVTLVGDAFAPEHMHGLWMAGHANIGITVFERWPTRMMDGMDFPGWMLRTWNDVGAL